MTENSQKHEILKKYDQFYLQDASKTILNRQQEFDLINKFKENNDYDARDVIINAYFRTILKLARKYSNKNNLSEIDLVHCGVVGICKALESFDVSQFKKSEGLLSYYIHRGVIMEMNLYYRENIRQFSVTDRTNYHLKMVNDLYKQGKFNDKDAAGIVEFVMKELKVNRSHATNLIDLFKPAIELNAQLKTGDDENGNDYLDSICQETKSADNILSNKEEREILMQSLYSLPISHKNILCYKFGVGHDKHHSLEEVSRKYNITPYVATKIIKDSQNKLKHLIKQNS